MKKATINGYLRKFGFEIHGTGYIQSVLKPSFKEDAFGKQKEISGEGVRTIFDIGGNRGDIAEKYNGLFPQATIYSFEPFEGTFKTMQERFLGNRSIKCYQTAISDTAEPKIFYVNANVDTNSLLKPKKTGLSSDKQVENKDTITVPCTTLDQFCVTNNILTIDILKMDIQGGEFSALKGSINLLKAGAIKLIYTEVYFLEQYEAQPLFHDISKFLFDYGFLLQDIYTPIYGKGYLAWGDAIFLQQHKV